MSDSHDQSYYEIALTNRQVLSIFVVLLVCVLVAFLGGVWLGKDADAAVEVASSQAILAGEDEDTPLEALDFFNRPSATGTGETPRVESGVASAAEPSQAGDRKARRAKTAAAEVPAPAKAALRTADPPASGDGSAGKAASTGAEPSRRDEPRPAPIARESVQAAADGAADSIPASVVIQVFSSNEEAQALRVADQLRKSGYPAILSPVEVAGRTLHRVRIGPYTDSDEARVVADSVRRAFKFDTWITH